MKIIQESKEKIVVKFDEFSHTVPNMIRERAWEYGAEFSGYNKPHPLINETTLTIIAKDPMKVLKDTVKSLRKDVKDIAKAIK